jgi:hypothetical protein
MLVTTEEEILDTAGAVSYLLVRFPELSGDTLKDTFYHQIARGKVPCERYRKGKVWRYRFKKSDLDHVTFRKARKEHIPRRTRITAADWGLEGVDEAYWKEFIPAEVHTADDLERLRHIFGPLVDGPGLISELYERFGVWYSAGAIKRRRYRGSILYVGFSGATRRTYWYPVAQLDVLNFQPENTKRASEAGRRVDTKEGERV